MTKHELSFVVAATPVGQPRQRHGAVLTATGTAKAVNYVDGKHPIHEFKYLIRETARLAMEAAHVHELAGPLHAGISFVFERPKRLCRKKDPVGRIPGDHITKDIDNLQKAVFDALNGIAYHDDRQITSVYCTKDYAAIDESAHVLVLIQELTDGEERS